MPGHDLHLPPEIWYEILTKLPVKSILRCRCVCKTWHSLVSSPTFISAQTLNQSTAGDRVLVERSDIYSMSKFSIHDKSFVESHEVPDVPEQLRSPVVEMVGSCDGLICFSKFYHRVLGTDGTCSVRSFLIWNPSIRKLLEVPYFCRSLASLLGFGFDSESRDYKVLRVVYNETYGHGQVWAKFDIFDLRKGVWRTSSSLVRPRFVSQPFDSANLYGNLHWIGKDLNSGNYALVCFNLSSEVLHEMEMVPDAAKPVRDDDCILSYTKVVPINGSLSLAVVKCKRQAGFRISVWAMKEYGVTESWAKLFNIELPCTKFLLNVHRFWESGEVLFAEQVVGKADGSYALVLHNSETKKYEALLSCEEQYSSVCFYKESLVLL